LASESQAAGFRIATHAIGDEAVDMVVDVYNEIAKDNVAQINHRIEHLGLPSESNLKIMHALNITAVMQPIFISELGTNFINYLDADYLNYLYPVRSVIDHGITLALSTDAPVVKNYDPVNNIIAAMTRRTSSGSLIAENQSITLEEALYAYTMGSAIAGGQDNSIGSITAGKFADFLILSALPGSGGVELQTFVEGNLAF
jgi:predicted amidohydrolase YtcJ